MAGLSAAPFRPPSSSSSNPNPSFSYRLLLLLTALPLALASFAFVLQWRGGLVDPASRWPDDGQKFPGMDNSPIGSSAAVSAASRLSSSDCSEILGRSSSPSFPYYRGLNFDIEDSNFRPKVSIASSTSAGLDQILPWLFYHKVIGVTTFFLFVEGKAAKPNISKVLESIPGVKVIYRTRELEEQQAKRLVNCWQDPSSLKKLLFEKLSHYL